MPECNKCHSSNVHLDHKPNKFHCGDCGGYFTYNENKPVVKSTSALKAQSKLECAFTTKIDRVRIIPLGDIHVGAPDNQCDWGKVERELQYILETPDCYMIGMGDYMDCASKMVRKGPNVYTSSLSPMEQYEKIKNGARDLYF